MDSRADSLAAELKRRDLFDDYFAWWLQERPTFADRLNWLKEKAINSSAGAIHRLHRSPEAAEWRKAEAARASEALRKSLPKNLDALVMESLRSQRFNAVLGELTHEQLMDHFRLENDTLKAELQKKSLAIKEADLALSREKFAVECCEKLLALVADAKAREIAEGSGSHQEKIAQLRQLYFADVDEMAASGRVKLPD